MSHQPHHDATIFSVPVRWAIRVLAWLAFFVSSYLAWTVATGSDVAGCGMGSASGCDLVLSSSWSTWLGLKVSVAGLACYASLAGLSVMIGLTSPNNSRWIDTLVVMLSTLAAGASLWFIGIQLLAIGHFCPYCMVVDTCGIVLGGLALWSAMRGAPAASQSRAAAAGVAALRSAMPGVGRVAPLQVSQSPARPASGLAIGGAVVILVVLILGQLLRPAKTHQLAKTALEQEIDMTGGTTDRADSPAESSPSAEPHTALRIPSESQVAEHDTSASNSPTPNPSSSSTGAESSTSTKADYTAPNPTPADASPKRKRVVEFLGGKLKLNTYEHPILGDPEAPHVMVEMVSYDCPHCRKMHAIMQRGQRLYGNQLAILLLVVPMEMKCNKLITDPKASHFGACTTARMALAVAEIKPTAFRQFHDFMMKDEKKTPTQQQAVGKAYSIVDSRRLREVANSEAIQKKIAGYVDLFATLQKQYPANGEKTFGLPVQILGDEVMTGSVEDSDDVYKAWEKNLGVRRR